MKNLIGFIIVLFILSCNNFQHVNNYIAKIELARSGGMWVNSSSAIYIDSSLNYERFNTATNKYFEGRINMEFWDKITSCIKNIKPQFFKTNDTMPMDADCWELIVYWRNSKTRLIKQVTLSNDSLSNTLLWLSDSFNHVKLKGTTHPIKFETTLQNWPTPSKHPI